jgi:hypothetical protein
MNPIGIAALVLGFISCDGPMLPRPVPARVLFIGNSLTYVNDLPGMVKALAESAGAAPFVVEQVVAADFSLLDHLETGVARVAIRRGGWDVVVMQQGPSSLDDSRAALLSATAGFDHEIRQVNARPALYGVWPERARIGVFDRVSESYRLAAAHVHGLYLPAGEAWRAAWRRDSTLALYGPDDVHPSVAGTYTAALVIVGRVADRSPVGLPARFRTDAGEIVDIAPATARLLQEAAAEANSLFPALPS